MLRRRWLADAKPASRAVQKGGKGAVKIVQAKLEKADGERALVILLVLDGAGKPLPTPGPTLAAIVKRTMNRPALNPLFAMLA